MKEYVTRFNPTTDGELHLGHIYLCLVNMTMADISRGKFIVRFDDNQEIWRIRRTVDDLNKTRVSIINDLTWMGIEVDEYESNSNLEFEARSILRTLNNGDLPVRRNIFVDNAPELMGQNMVLYPYLPHVTAEKVVMDMMQGVNLLIRGVDLITEASLYMYYCDLFGIPAPQQVYLPRLKFGVAEIMEMSKTKGNGTVRSYRESGKSPDDIMKMLTEACLINKIGRWTVDNIKAEPVIS